MEQSQQLPDPRSLTPYWLVVNRPSAVSSEPLQEVMEYVERRLDAIGALPETDVTDDVWEEKHVLETIQRNAKRRRDEIDALLQTGKTLEDIDKEAEQWKVGLVLHAAQQVEDRRRARSFEPTGRFGRWPE